MRDQILKWIDKRWSFQTAQWLNGNCYWFQRMLKDEFDLDIYYLPISGHFVAGPKDRANGDGNFFDITGVIDLKEEQIKLSDIEEIDPLWYGRLIRDCKD